MTDILQKTDSIAIDLNKLANEMHLVLRYTKSLWGKPEDLGNHHFPYVLYGFMMCMMAKVDYLSQHWILGQPDQTKRMVDFLNEYLGYPKKASEIAVQFFRHNLMHTSMLAEISDNEGNKYRWLLHHGNEDIERNGQVEPDLKRVQHMMLEPGKLNAGAFYFLDDLIAALPKLRKAAEKDVSIGVRWAEVEERIRKFPRRYKDDGTTL